MSTASTNAPLALLLKLRAKKLIADARRRLLGNGVTAVLTETPNGILLVSIEDLSVARKLAHSGGYDGENIGTLAALIGPDSRVLIVGAHVGALLIPLAKISKGVVAIEANPDTMRILKRNVLLNNLTNVTAMQLAAWNSTGDLDFLKSTVNSGGSKVDTQSGRLEFTYDNPSKCRVPCRRLDDALGGDKFDLVVMDIEGAEYNALLGMPGILARAKELQVEILPNHIDNIAKVDRHTFLKAIPPEFGFARVLGNATIYSWHDFGRMLNSIWRTDYFSGVDVLFARTQDRLRSNIKAEQPTT